MPSTRNTLHREQLHAEALRLDRLGAHDHAERLFAQLLATDEARMGSHHPDLIPTLNDLARCRFNAGLLLPALQDYRRLEKLLDPSSDDVLIAMARHQIRRCIDGVRQRLASAGLQASLAVLIRQARAQRAVGETAAQQRLRSLARRLIARGRVTTGAQLMQRWLGEVLQARHPVDNQALHDLRDHAIALWNAGHPQLAEPMLRDIVRVLQRQQADEPAAWAQALRDWGACLAAAGHPRSARHTLALAESLSRAPSGEAATRQEPVDDIEVETAPVRASPWRHDLMLTVLQRCSFICGLYWEDEPGPLDVRLEGETAFVGGAIRFDDASGPWLPVRLSTPADAEPNFPHLDATLRLPQCLSPADNPERVLAVMSRLSGRTPGVSVTFDSDSGDISLMSRLVYTGSNIDGDAPSEGRRMLEEVTLNTVLGLLSAAQAWLEQGQAHRGATPPGKDDDESTR